MKYKQNYAVVSLPRDIEDQQALLMSYGQRGWFLIAVSDGVAYFRRLLVESHVPDAAAPGTTNVIEWAADESAGEKKIEVISNEDTTFSGIPHVHRVLVIVGPDKKVRRGKTDVVAEHVHEVSPVIGFLEEADGHTHVYNVSFGLDQ